MSEAHELRLTLNEETRIYELLHPGTDIEVVIPKTIDPDTLWADLALCCKAYRHAERLTLRVRPLIGRMLWVIRNNPEHYLRRGFKTYEEFLAKAVEPDLGMGRSLAYETKAIAKTMPSLSPDTYEKIGPRKMSLLVRYTNEKNSNYKEELERAETHTYKELKAYAVERKFISAGEITPVVITINATQEIAHMWRKLRTAKETIEQCGTDKEGQIFMHLLEEWAGQYGVDLT